MEKEIKVTIKKKVSSKTGKPYVALVYDVGYKDIIIALEPYKIAEIMDLSIAEAFEYIKTLRNA